VVLLERRLVLCAGCGDKDGEIRTVELAPTTGSAILGIDRLWPVVESQYQHALRTELDAQAATLAPVIKNVNLAPRQMPILRMRIRGARFVPNLYTGWVILCGHLCSSSNTDGLLVDDDTQKGGSCQAPRSLI
jgi:hypothetical protein